MIEQIQTLIALENARQQHTISLIASENHCSAEVRNAQGSRLTDKYAEGYPEHRYYQGCKLVDQVEQIAIDRACKLFGSQYANVQPHSGSQANIAIFTAFLKPGDRILALNLKDGGHLTHGAAANVSGKLYEVHHYGVNIDGIIDMDNVGIVAHKCMPHMIIAGASSYARIIDWAGFRRIADDVGAFFLADIAHYAGLIAGGYNVTAPDGCSEGCRCRAKCVSEVTVGRAIDVGTQTQNTSVQNWYAEVEYKEKCSNTEHDGYRVDTSLTHDCMRDNTYRESIKPANFGKVDDTGDTACQDIKHKCNSPLHPEQKCSNVEPHCLDVGHSVKYNKCVGNKCNEFTGSITPGDCSSVNPVYPSPVPYADFVTSTTHKVLRGPRGGLILWNNQDYTKRINASIFPGNQGGPMMHSIAAKAICFEEAMQPDFTNYARMVVSNARIMVETLVSFGWTVISGGTDCHMFTLDLGKMPELTGAKAAMILEEQGIIVNKQAIPGDHRGVTSTSGIRIGTAAMTSRGMRNEDAKLVAKCINQALNDIEVKNEISILCAKYPLP